MILTLVLALLLQDPSIDENVKALSHADESVRGKAAAELMKTPLAKLDQLEKHRTDPNGKASVRLRRIMTQVLASNLGTPKPRLHFRPCAMPDFMKDWIDQGADPKKAPKGHECLQVKKGVLNLGGDHEIYKRERILVESSIITEKDLEEASAEINMGGRTPDWGVACRLSDEGAVAFDTCAFALFNRVPKGLMAIVVDDRIVTAPIINAERFSGKVTIAGGFSQEEAQGLAKIFMGEWLDLSMRVERERVGVDAPEKLADPIRAMKGLGKIAASPNAGGLEISGLIDIKEADLISIWKSLREQGHRLVPKK